MKRFCLFLLVAGPFVVQAQLLRFDTIRLRPWNYAQPRLSPWTVPTASLRVLSPDRMPCLTVSRPVEPMPVDKRGNADRMVYRKRTEFLVESEVKH